jgi:hypothetical protein
MAKKPNNLKALQKKDAALDKKLGPNDQDKGKGKFDFKAFIAGKKKK